MSTERPSFPLRPPEGADPEMVAAFEETNQRIQEILDRIDADHQAAVARLEAQERRRRRMLVVAAVWQVAGFGLCVASIYTVEWLYWVGYTMVITGMFYMWWDLGYFQKMHAWARGRWARWNRSRS